MTSTVVTGIRGIQTTGITGYVICMPAINGIQDTKTNLPMGPQNSEQFGKPCFLSIDYGSRSTRVSGWVAMHGGVLGSEKWAPILGGPPNCVSVSAGSLFYDRFGSTYLILIHSGHSPGNRAPFLKPSRSH